MKFKVGSKITLLLLLITVLTILGVFIYICVLSINFCLKEALEAYSIGNMERFWMWIFGVAEWSSYLAITIVGLCLAVREAKCSKSNETCNSNMVGVTEI